MIKIEINTHNTITEKKKLAEIMAKKIGRSDDPIFKISLVIASMIENFEKFEKVKPFYCL